MRLDAMQWLLQLNADLPVAHAIGILVMVCMAGMALGSVKVRGAGLGSAGVLFAGILVGHFGRPVDASTLAFVKEFGLVLFVFTIGLQLGPGFFAALRRQGVRMNALAAATVFLGAACAVALGWLAGFDRAAVLGIFSGASINMPSLGAATQTLSTIPGLSAERMALPALASAVTFPTAIVAVMLTVLLIQRLFRIQPAVEAAAFAAAERGSIEPIERRTLLVTNPNLDGLQVDQIPGRLESGVTVSRVGHGSDVHVATNRSPVRQGDRILAIGTHAALDRFQRIIGERSGDDLMSPETGLTNRRVAVTAHDVLGKTIGELDLDDCFGVAVTRITRADVEVTAVPNLRLQFGDVVQIVGRDADLDTAARTLGNSVKELNETHFVPLFVGMFAGVLVGTFPIAVPGFPEPLRLGLAAGPLIVALVIGRVGRIGRLVFHMPVNANLAFREFGVALFFAAVGLEAGPTFFQTVVSATGVQWLLAGACVTMLPILLVATVARSALKMNFVELAGLLAGSMTAPPALTFANELSRSDAPTVAYAMVYPLTMLLRVLCAQALTFILCG
jgi:putative transport protein